MCHAERSEGFVCFLGAASTTCHAERSEGSLSMGNEMLRCAQHDNAYRNAQIITGVPALDRRSEIRMNVHIFMLQVMQLMHLL